MLLRLIYKFTLNETPNTLNKRPTFDHFLRYSKSHNDNDATFHYRYDNPNRTPSSFKFSSSKLEKNATDYYVKYYTSTTTHMIDNNFITKAGKNFYRNLCLKATSITPQELVNRDKDMQVRQLLKKAAARGTFKKSQQYAEQQTKRFITNIETQTTDDRWGNSNSKDDKDENRRNGD